jgi:glycine/D-amino acid oxidase-like deaminating enzyme
LPDNRLLFGGRGSADGSERSADRNYRRLIRRLYELFPAWNAVKVDYRWHGLVCMTRRMTPAIGRMADDPSVFYAFGYHGNGVNTATWAGKQLADWLGTAATADARPPAWLPGVVAGEPGRFPLARLRLAYIQAALAWLSYKDGSG